MNGQNSFHNSVKEVYFIPVVPSLFFENIFGEVSVTNKRPLLDFFKRRDYVPGTAVNPAMFHIYQRKTQSEAQMHVMPSVFTITSISKVLKNNFM